ncbi:uncharacterized protein METZ01_LOCUS439427, partial [marine metagenome]
IHTAKRATHQLTISVDDNNDRPIPNVGVSLWATIGGISYSHWVDLDDNGTRTVGVLPGTWTVDPKEYRTGKLGYNNPAPDRQDVVVADSNASVYFSADPEFNITEDPDSQVVAAGGSVTLDVTATGSDLSYQWQHNGVNIAGATSRTLTINNFAAANEGAYQVRVSQDPDPDGDDHYYFFPHPTRVEEAVLALPITNVSSSSASDDFSGALNTTKWGTQEFRGGAGRLAQSSGALRYYTQGTPTDDDWAARLWHPQALPYN